MRHDEAIAEAAALTDRSDLARVPIAAKEVTAVAAGLFRWRKGTDALGSVCSPAAICGLVDITPGSGTVRASDFSDWSRMYTHGPLATTVSGAAALLSVLGPLALLRAAGHHVVEATPHYGTIVSLESVG